MKIDSHVQGLLGTSTAYLPVFDPSTGRELAELVDCDTDMVAQVVARARVAQPAWWHRAAEERGRALRRFAEVIRDHQAELTELNIKDGGMPTRDARVDVTIAARYFEYYGSTVEAVHGQSMQLGGGSQMVTIREPFGVTAHVSSYNYPLQMCARSVAPALAMGNACVLKPSEMASLAVARMVELAALVDLPDGIFGLVTGDAATGSALIEHPAIAHISFTGSRPAGRAIAAAAAARGVPLLLELGGKSPQIVFEDADLDAALPRVVNGITQYAGQICNAGSRLLVHDSIFERLVDDVAQRFRAMTIGAAETDPDLGPLVSQRQLARVGEIVDAARSTARIVTGGGPADLGGGYFYQPTLIDGLAHDNEAYREEIFGPVLVAERFDTDDAAVQMANDSEFGLVAGVWTDSLGRAKRLVSELDAGQIHINTFSGGLVSTPFGGNKGSGYGRIKGYEALFNFCRTKAVTLG